MSYGSELPSRPFPVVVGKSYASIGPEGFPAPGSRESMRFATMQLICGTCGSVLSTVNGRCNANPKHRRIAARYTDYRDEAPWETTLQA